MDLKLQYRYPVAKSFTRILLSQKLQTLCEDLLQCCGYMTFWCGSGSGSAGPCLLLMDPDPAFVVIDLQDANKLILKKYFAY
jgi:hypothetical protein